jgi:cobalt/nickel transport system ATP-binding protein
MTDRPMIRTKGLDFSYPSGEPALKGVTMEIERGKKCVFLGPNGAGKSTLFLHFNGILKPKGGEVLFDEKALRYDQRSLIALREQVAMVLQNPDDQIFSTTVEEDVAFGPMNLLLPRDEVERRIDYALNLVGMENLRARPTQQLSFGQRKRVSLAGALAMKPRVLIMDEPTAGLDSEMVHELMELSDELNHGGMTIIISTHDIETAYEWADEMKVMCKGEVLFSGSPEDLFTQKGLIDKLRIVPPFPVLLNQQMHYRTGKPEVPYPRNLAELSQKSFPLVGVQDINKHCCCEEDPDYSDNRGVFMGTIHIVDINDPAYAERVSMLTDELGDIQHSSGAYGDKARRMARDGKIDVHHSFHALENAFLQVSLGQDYVLYTDSSLLSLVRSNLGRVEEKAGLRFKISMTGGADRPLSELDGSETARTGVGGARRFERGGQLGTDRP